MPTRGFVHSALLHSNEAIFNEVDASNSVVSPDLVKRYYEIDGVELNAVDRNRGSRVESDRDVLGLIRSILRRCCQHEEICRRSDSGLLEHATFMRDVPDVPSSGVDLVARGGNWNLVGLRVGNRVLAAPDTPFAPGRYHRQVGCERRVSELKPDLVVAFSGATV